MEADRSWSNNIECTNFSLNNVTRLGIHIATYDILDGRGLMDCVEHSSSDEKPSRGIYRVRLLRNDDRKEVKGRGGRRKQLIAQMRVKMAGPTHPL